MTKAAHKQFVVSRQVTQIKLPEVQGQMLDEPDNKASLP
jgi:hypothetical protein